LTSRFEVAVVVIHTTQAGLLGKLFPIERALGIGRDPSSDLVLDSAEILPHHATIRTFGSNLEIETSSADAKVLVNDRETTFSVLEHLSEIALPGLRLRVLLAGNAEAAYHEEIYRLTMVDGLTRLFNRRYLIEALEREMLRARRYDRPLAVAGFCIEGLPRLVEGDHHLRKLAGAFSAASPREHIVARVDGFELVVVMPETELDAAKTQAARLTSDAETAVSGARVIWMTTTLHAADVHAHEILERVRVARTDTPPSA
jgi:two-component system, cell cycle response regulator